MNEEDVLSYEEALEMLPDKERIHTFVQPNVAILGADWDRSEVLKAFALYKVGLSGPQATKMGHGLVFWDGTRNVFIETSSTKSG